MKMSSANQGTDLAERESTPAFIAYNSVLSPHTPVVRFTYTVLENTILLVSSVTMAIYQTTAPTTQQSRAITFSYNRDAGGSVDILALTNYQPLFDAIDRVTFPTSYKFRFGDVITFSTIDLSVGGQSTFDMGCSARYYSI